MTIEMEIISWVGEQYETDLPAYKNKSTVFYKKCIFGPLTLKTGDHVLISNTDNADYDTVEGCDVAKILHMYELFDPSVRDRCRAIVQWYSRPDKLPKYVVQNENYIFDFNKEIVEDSRFDSDISLETIYGLCKVTLADTSTLPSALVKSKSRIPEFIVRYKLEQPLKLKRYQLFPILGTKHLTPKKRRTTMGIVEQPKDNDQRKTPKIKLVRTQSMETLKSSSTPKDFVGRDEWVVKVVENRRSSSYKKKLNDITDALSDVEIIGDQEASPPKKTKVSVSKRKSIDVRRNLNDSMNCTDPNNTADSGVLNYSIVKEDINGNTPDMKIKLRLSERQKSKLATDSVEASTPTRRSTRKRSTTDEQPDTELQTTPRKTRKSILIEETKVETVNTTPRRRSILKTPNSKLENIGTPKKNIQLSNIVEEFGGDQVHKSHKTPQKQIIQKEKQKTPKSSCSSRQSLSGTPKSASKIKLIRDGKIQPNMQVRNKAIGNIMTDLQVARERLHVSAVPKSLPCREKEFDDIHTFLEAKIVDQCGGCMYVSGVPGTGKTATVTEVIRILKEQAENDEIPNFEFVEINGMRLTEPRQAYVHIYRQLTGKTLAWEQAYSLLEKRFTTKAPRRLTTVLLVDELDILCNRRQDVVYNLLNWPTMSEAQLVVITIANTMDLPERVLMGKITSRMGLTRLTFQPYTYKQLQEIVTARLCGTNAFVSEAIQLVARKVASVSGDARRALDICRRSTEIADEKARKTGDHVMVSIGHVQQALEEMISSAKVQAIQRCSKMEKLFLQAVTAEVTRTGIEEVTFIGVYAQLEILTGFSGTTTPAPGRIISLCSRLGSYRLLICEHSRNDIYQKILLNVSSDDVHFALQQNSN